MLRPFNRSAVDHKPIRCVPKPDGITHAKNPGAMLLPHNHFQPPVSSLVTNDFCLKTDHQFLWIAHFERPSGPTVRTVSADQQGAAKAEFLISSSDGELDTFFIYISSNWNRSPTKDVNQPPCLAGRQIGRTVFDTPRRCAMYPRCQREQGCHWDRESVRHPLPREPYRRLRQREEAEGVTSPAHWNGRPISACSSTSEPAFHAQRGCGCDLTQGLPQR